MSSPQIKTTDNKSNTGIIIFVVIVALISITALILSIIPFFQNTSGESNGQCPQKGCDIDAKNLSAVNLSVTNIKNKLTFEEGFISNGPVSFPSAEYGDLEATEISGTNINYTNATFSNISNSNLVKTINLTTTNARFLNTIKQNGIYFTNNTSTSVGVRDIVLTSSNTFYTLELGSSGNNINLLLDGTNFSSGQSIILNCWSRPNATFSQTSINLSNSLPQIISNNTTTTYKILDTISGGFVTNTQLLERNPTEARSRNYYIHYFANTFHLMRMGSSN